MEQDRFEVNHKLYIIDMICLVFCLGFLFFSSFILPYLIWELHYHVPVFVLNLIAKLHDDYHYGVRASKLIVWLIFFIPSLMAGFISYWSSNYIDNKIYKKEIEPTETQENISSEETGGHEAANLTFKIFGLMILVIIVILLLQFLVQLTA